MSRHQAVKAINDKVTKSQAYDDLDDYDDEEYDAEEAEEQMRDGVRRAREVLGDEFTEEQIRESLWHYFYDVEKTVNYLLKQKTAAQSKPPPNRSKATMNPNESTCSQPFSVADFFKDCPWLSVPIERRGEILVEPLYPRGRLLGGSSQGSGKPSKLAALAAARKKKENEKAATEGKAASSSLAILDKLGPQADPSTKRKPQDAVSGNRGPATTDKSQTPATKPRKYPVRQKKELPLENPSKPKEEPVPEPNESAAAPEPEPSVNTEPSDFAQTILGSSPPQSSSPDIKPHLMQFNVFPESLTENPFAGPSPDDVVAKAQSVSKGLKLTKGPAKKDKAVDGVAKDLDKAKIDDAPQAKSKNLDVPAEYEKSEKKNSANFVVIGHVDSGKSTLMGRLLYDMKVIDERTIAKYRREAEQLGKASFALAWVLDSGSDERAYGVTIDFAAKRFKTDKTAFTILDAPGHRDFIPNMIAGASQADFAVLVVDASTGNFESGLKGQTKEHALLVRSVGAQRMIVAINKLDEVNWSQDRYDEIQQQVSAFLAAAGFQDSNVSFVPCSGLNGDNVTKRCTDSASSWYRGPILLDQLDKVAIPRTYAISGPLRLQISDVFSGGVQFPLSVAGRITSGNVQVGDKVICCPSNDSGFIRAIEVDDDLKDWAVAGMNVTLHLSHIDSARLKTGDIICNPANPVISRASFVIKALVFEHIFPQYLGVIVGRTNVEGRVENPLMARLDKSTGEVAKKKPKIFKPGDMGRMRIVVEEEGGLPIEAWTRVVLRDEGKTLATGLVEDL